jgi:hypothetical protein
MMSTFSKKAVLFGILVAAWPASVAAQACFGFPTSDGQFGLAGVVDFTEGTRGYGADFNANLAGPVSFILGYSLVDIEDIDTNGNSFRGLAGFELSVPSVSMCPGAGVRYSRAHEASDVVQAEATATLITIPVGVGVGKQIAAGQNFYVTLFGFPHYLYVDAKLTAKIPGQEFEFSDNSSEFGTDLGIRFGTSAFFAGAGVTLTTIEDSDPSFGLIVGIIFGGRR